ncbi:Eukaryotic translation initiation factor 4G [Platanthera guangdongensis]|uniref:Eukaryotic translation initiation factor 4G n=1 Tax=Platanthera guangdongensis TaxID=2320717 RepID=A0ABR2LQ01_9ASPA
MSSFPNLSVVFCYADREEEVSFGFMSQIQSRTEKIVGHRRKPGRTGSVAPGRVSSGGGEAAGGGGGVAAPPPAFPSAAVPRPSRASNGLPNNQSSKNSGSQQGGQSRMNPSKSNSNSDTAALNGVCNTLSSQGGECAPFLQFGTINPAMVKGMQVPARTCSAPPNLDEQKTLLCELVRQDSLKAAPALATLSASKPLPPHPVPQQKQQTKQVGVSQAEIREAHSSAHAKRDTILAPMSTAPTTILARTSVLPVGGIPMHHLPFQQPLVPVQFSGPNIPMQPHAIVPASFPMALPSVNVSQVPPSMFVPSSIQSHPMLPQAIMHHGQNLAFAPPLGHQFSPHLNNMVHSITPQFPQQQQPEKLIPQRRAVKITHPDTHEELKLDKRTVSLANSGTSGHRQLQSAVSQSSSFPSFNHQISYPTAYNHSPVFFPSPSVPLTSTQMSTGPQAAIYNYPVGQNGQPISFPGSSHFDAAFGGRPGPLPPSHGLLAHNSEGSSFSASLGHPAQLLVKPAGLLPSEKTGTTSVRISMPVAKKESSKLIKLSGDVPVAPQQKDMDVGYQNTGLAQKQNCEPLVTDSLPSENDKNCSTPSSSTHGDGSEALFSVSAPVSDASMAVVAEKNNENDEALIVTESVHNHQKMLCEMELKQSQPQEGELSDPTLNKCEILCSEDAAAREPCILLSDMAAAPSISPEIYVKPEIKSVELCNGAQTPVLSRVLLERNRSRNKKKKKKKEIYSKADAAGCSDPYSAYKPTKEKLEADSFLETIESSSTAKSNRDSAKDSNSVVIAIDQKDQSKAESVDCEVAVDASTPKLRTLENGVPEHLEKKIQTYSKDFLLSFSERCKDLPYGFEVGSELISIMSLSTGMKRGNGNDSIASFGRDRSSGPARGDRRMAAISDDRWNKSSALRMDHIHEKSSTNYRPAQGVNNGVLRNPSMHSTNHPSSGVLPGPMHSLSSQGGIGKNNSDLDQWQRPSGIQRGIMPPPRGPVQAFHKSANRYVIGRASDEEEKKQRRLKAILNKLTPQNFDKLLDQVKEVNIDNTVTLNGVISQIFDKALMEPTFCEMYADFCLHLATALPDFVEENEKITFRRLLLNKCQEEFERGEREQAEADRADEEGEIQQTEDEREEKRIRAHRRMLGNIRFIGELYKKKMLTDRIMHECMKTLLGQYQNPDEENIEALCKLMSTIGAMIDHTEAKKHMDAYFDRITMLSTNQKLSSRLRFMLKDTIDLRKNKWRQRRKVEGPKKIEDVHKDAAQERQAQTSKVGRGPTVPSRRGPPVDYSHRGSTVLNSTSSQMSGGIRSLEGNVRGSSRQDARLDERHHFEKRMQSIPLPHRPSNDGSVTLGPQGGLAKGMSGRGQGLISNIPSAEISRRVGNSHRMASGSNGFGSTSTDRLPSITREESMPKYGASGSFGETKDQTSFQGTRGSHFADRAPDRPSIATSGRVSGSSCDKISASSEPKALSEGTLREKSLSAIREFYRFESVLLTLEDAVNDAPKAGEFLGHIFGRVVAENVIQLMEIGRLIHEGGEAPGTLVEAGLGSDILGSLLEFVQAEKGDLFLNDIRVSSKLRLDDFKPPNPSSNSKKLNAFL